MKKKSLLKCLALAIAIVMIFSLTACTTQKSGDNKQTTDAAPDNNQATTAPETKSGKLFDEPTEIKIVMGSHASWPYNPDWVIWDIVEEATNVKFNIEAIPNTEMATKIGRA